MLTLKSRPENSRATNFVLRIGFGPFFQQQGDHVHMAAAVAKRDVEQISAIRDDRGECRAHYKSQTHAKAARWMGERPLRSGTLMLAPFMASRSSAPLSPTAGTNGKGW